MKRKWKNRRSEKKKKTLWEREERERTRSPYLEK
jgi:hypothetical protein